MTTFQFSYLPLLRLDGLLLSPDEPDDGEPLAVKALHGAPRTVHQPLDHIQILQEHDLSPDPQP